MDFQSWPGRQDLAGEARGCTDVSCPEDISHCRECRPQSDHSFRRKDFIRINLRRPDLPCDAIARLPRLAEHWP